MKRIHVFWLVWVLSGIGVELWTSVNDEPGDTLSEGIFTLMTNSPAFYWLVAAAIVWLGVHLLSRGKY